VPAKGFVCEWPLAAGTAPSDALPSAGSVAAFIRAACEPTCRLVSSGAGGAPPRRLGRARQAEPRARAAAAHVQALRRVATGAELSLAHPAGESSATRRGKFTKECLCRPDCPTWLVERF
jgi:hypothetical protein